MRGALSRDPKFKKLAASRAESAMLGNRTLPITVRVAIERQRSFLAIQLKARVAERKKVEETRARLARPETDAAEKEPVAPLPSSPDAGVPASGESHP